MEAGSADVLVRSERESANLILCVSLNSAPIACQVADGDVRAPSIGRSRFNEIDFQAKPVTDSVTLLLFIQLRKLFAQVLELRQVVINDVRIVRVIDEIILVIAFGFDERLQGSQLSCDFGREDFRLV